MMNEETKASLNKFLKEREERIKNMTLAEARDIVSSTYGHSDMRMESDKALQMLLDCADKVLEKQSFINKPCVSEGGGMTDLEARRIIIQNTESLKANPLVTVDDCLYEAFDTAINALEQRGCVWEIAYERGKVEVLDKIRAEIERKAHSGQWSDATMYGMLKAVAIIDKYRVGSEGGE